MTCRKTHHPAERSKRQKWDKVQYATGSRAPYNTPRSALRPLPQHTQQAIDSSAAQRFTHQQYSTQLDPGPSSDLNSVISLAMELYRRTLGMLPNHLHVEPEQLNKTIYDWSRLMCIPKFAARTGREMYLSILQQDMLLGKFADIIYLLVEINNHRNKQRNQQTVDLLQRSAAVLKLPEIAVKLTAMQNPFFLDDKYGRATKGMRFHIYASMLNTYVVVVGITGAFWGLKKMQLEISMTEDGRITNPEPFQYLTGQAQA
ncbi:hypothetical protein FN846DRAFT_990932 [Sphaerosporella brunnea]|uniref:Uncharacterized protein n=1 Tax=Sphaerosporella brunnea TaxID=1250544 RepID=A0A5J5ENX7_9PEZI|nr:hypothetical protein FN846DRAFT_990932 [Sphaerosporella brunnea]